MLRGGRGRARAAVGGGMCSTCRANCEYYLHCAARFPLRGKIEKEKEKKIFMNREGGICMRGIIFMSPEPWQAEPSRRLQTFIMRLHDPVPLRHLCLTDSPGHGMALGRPTEIG